MSLIEDLKYIILSYTIEDLPKNELKGLFETDKKLCINSFLLVYPSYFYSKFEAGIYLAQPDGWESMWAVMHLIEENKVKSITQYAMQERICHFISNQNLHFHLWKLYEIYKSRQKFFFSCLQLCLGKKKYQIHKEPKKENDDFAHHFYDMSDEVIKAFPNYFI